MVMLNKTSLKYFRFLSREWPLYVKQNVTEQKETI